MEEDLLQVLERFDILEKYDVTLDLNKLTISYIIDGVDDVDAHNQSISEKMKKKGFDGGSISPYYPIDYHIEVMKAQFQLLTFLKSIVIDSTENVSIRREEQNRAIQHTITIDKKHIDYHMIKEFQKMFDMIKQFEKMFEKYPNK